MENAVANEFFLCYRILALIEMSTQSATEIKPDRLQPDRGQTGMFTILRLTGENLAAKIQLTKIRAARLRECASLHLASGGGFGSVRVAAK